MDASDHPGRLPCAANKPMGSSAECGHRKGCPPIVRSSSLFNFTSMTILRRGATEAYHSNVFSPSNHVPNRCDRHYDATGNNRHESRVFVNASTGDVQTSRSESNASRYSVSSRIIISKTLNEGPQMSWKQTFNLHLPAT